MNLLEQALGEVTVVCEPGLPHQRGVGGEARDPWVLRKREDRVEVGSVGEDLHREGIHHNREL